MVWRVGFVQQETGEAHKIDSECLFDSELKQRYFVINWRNKIIIKPTDGDVYTNENGWLKTIQN